MKCTSSGDGGPYYHELLPVLGMWEGGREGGEEGGSKPSNLLRGMRSHMQRTHHYLLSSLAGSQLTPPDPKEFVSGDKVQAEVDMDVLKSIEGSPELAENFALVGGPTAAHVMWTTCILYNTSDFYNNTRDKENMNTCDCMIT